MSEEDIILRRIEDKIPEFIEIYNERPKYVKIPLFMFIKLKNYAKELMTNFNYKELEEDEDFTVFGLKVCETITINSIEDIEVF